MKPTKGKRVVHLGRERARRRTPEQVLQRSYHAQVCRYGLETHQGHVMTSLAEIACYLRYSIASLLRQIVDGLPVQVRLSEGDVDRWILLQNQKLVQAGRIGPNRK